MEKKRTLHQYINYVRRKKEVRATVLYTVSYFVYMTILMAVGLSTGKI